MSLTQRFDAMHHAAAAATGLDDFGGDDYVEPMRRLLAGIDASSELLPEGEQLVAGDFTGLLVGRLLVQAGLKAKPELADAPFEKPLIIIGMARTGTTALQRLLSRDPACQSLPLWLATLPMPRPPRETWAAHPGFRQVAQGIEALHKAAPEFRHIHPMQADEPDECRLVLAQAFWAPGFITADGSAPAYADWCLDCDMRYAYRYYRRVLALVANGDRRRWLLKCPTHVWGLDALLDVFPDANVVFTHRDVRTSMISTASMTYSWRRTRDPGVTPRQVSREILANWGRALDRAERARQRHDPARFFDVHVSETHADILGTAERIYRHFDLPFSAGTRAVLAAYAQHDPRAGHGEHRYDLEAFELGEDEILAGVGAYAARNQAIEAMRHQPGEA